MNEKKSYLIASFVIFAFLISVINLFSQIQANNIPTSKGSIILPRIEAANIIDIFQQNQGNSNSPYFSGNYFSDSLNVRLIGRWADGPCLTVAVANNHAYLGNGSWLEIVNLDIPNNPKEVSKLLLPAPILGIKLDGNGYRAYIANSSAGLQIIDVSNPSHPLQSGSLDTPDRACDLDIRGTYIYLADGKSGLRVIDVAMPSNPTEVGSFPTPDQALAVAIKDNNAYVACGAAGLLIIDISIPAIPNKIASCPTTAETRSVAIAGDHAYVAIGNAGIEVINISNPYNPTKIKTYRTNGSAIDIAISETYAYAYVAAGLSGLRVIDISNPINPREIGYSDTEGIASAIALGVNYAYVADGFNGLRAIYIANPHAPEETGFYKTAGVSRGVAISGKNAYIARGEAGLAVLDISNPAQPMMSDSLNLNGSAEDIQVKGNYAYVTHYDKSVHVIDVSDASNLKNVGSYSQNIHPNRIVLSQNYAYVSDLTIGLRILDVFNPRQPISAGIFDIGGKANGIAMKANQIYLAGNQGLNIIDVSVPTLPKQIGKFLTAGMSVAAAENYAYLGTGANGLRLIDITNPARPAEISFLSLKDSVNELMASGRYVYLANAKEGLRIIDVSNPSVPIEVGYYRTGGKAYDLAIDDKFIYLTDEMGGLYILEFSGVSQNIAPGAPVLISPANHAFLNTLSPRLTWQIPKDSNGDRLHFRLEMDKAGDWNPIDNVIESKNNPTNFLPTPPVSQNSGIMNFIHQMPLAEGKLFWRVSAWDGLVYGPNSEIRHFILDVTAPILKNLLFENPVYGKNWFNPHQDTSVTAAIFYDETYPEKMSFISAILNDTLRASNLLGGTNQSAHLNFSIAGQADGIFPFIAILKDSAGNSGSIADTIKVDGTPPSGYFSDAPDTIMEGENYRVHIRGTTDGQGSGFRQIYLDVFTNSAGVPTTAQDSLPGITAPGIYFYRYFAVDNVGNRGIIQTDTTVVLPIPTEAPIFPTVSTSEINAGVSFWLDIHVGTEQEPVKNLFNVSFILNYTNSQYIEIASADSILSGEFFGQDVSLTFQLDETSGKIAVNISRKPGASGVDGSGTLLRMRFISDPNTPHRTPVHFSISAVTAKDPSGNLLTLVPQDTSIWIIQPLSDFTMHVTPDSQSVFPGDSVQFTLSFEPLGRFDFPVSLEILGLPEGMRTTYLSQPFQIPASFALTIATTEDVNPDVYPLVLRASGGGKIHSDTIKVNVLPPNPAPDFQMMIIPESRIIKPGENANFVLSIEPLGGFDARISLTISSLPAGMKVNSFAEPFPIPRSIDLIFSTTSEIAPGVYDLVITATGGGITHERTITINVIPLPDFIMTIKPDSQAVMPGERIEFTITFEPLGGFDAAIVLMVSNVPEGMEVIFSSRPFTIPISVSVAFFVPRHVPTAVYHPIVTATGSGITHDETVAVNVLPLGPSALQYDAQPNPFTPNGDGYNDYVIFRIPETPSGKVTILIFDMNGRKITEIQDSIYWYGKDDQGRNVKPGVYIFIIKDGEKIYSKGSISVAL